MTLSRFDDRVESPQGITPKVALSHDTVASVNGDWPDMLGYNRVTPKEGGNVVVTVGDDPLLVTGTYGQGRTVAFTSDCGPHWAPPPFVEWPGYAPLWQGIVDWAAGK